MKVHLVVFSYISIKIACRVFKDRVFFKKSGKKISKIYWPKRGDCSKDVLGRIFSKTTRRADPFILDSRVIVYLYSVFAFVWIPILVFFFFF